MEVFLRLVEALRVRWLAGAPRLPVTFVVGAPRSGTTLVGLHLLRARRLATFPNVAKAHPRYPWLATRRALRRGAAEFDYANAYGQTAGDLSPSDGWDLVERCFESYREARAEHAPEARLLVQLVAAFEALYGAPFLLKNNANSMRVEALERLFPGCLWIHVRRALPEAAASLLEARKRHNVPLGQWWSAAPPQFLACEFESEIEQVAFTLLGIERYLDQELAPPRAQGRALELDYDEFCARPGEAVDWLDRRYAERGVRLERNRIDLPERFEASRLKADERERLERELAPYVARVERSLAHSVLEA